MIYHPATINTEANVTAGLDPAKLTAWHARLQDANARFERDFPGVAVARQPVHTVYGGAHLFSAGAAGKLGGLARRHLAAYAPTFVDLARALGFDGAETLPFETAAIEALEAAYDADGAALARVNPAAWTALTVFRRVHDKLGAEPVEDQRLDFEDGYGARADAEEDEHAEAAARQMAKGMQEGTLAPFIGIRVKSLSEEARQRSLRTLDLFLTTLLEATAGGLPDNFVVTLPKVTAPEQVAVLSECLSAIEAAHGLADQSIGLELMIETIQSLFDSSGRNNLRRLVDAGDGRVTAAILGTFDYTATCNIASTHQSHMHPSADFCRLMMQVTLTGTSVTLSDGITNIMPIPTFRGADADLTQHQILENRAVVLDAWKLHFDNVTHSLALGLYQSWDLNPAQLPVRFAAVYYFFVSELEAAQARLRTFINQAAQASLVGNVFDDAASAQGLLNFFVSGINCGALTRDEALATGITLAELEGRSFKAIVANRTGS